MKKLSLIIFATLALQLSGCATTTKDSVSGVKRSQFMLLPSGTVDKMSAQAYTETLQTAKKKNTLNADTAQLERVRTISNRLIAQVGVFRPDAVQWNWEVNVEKDDQVNAYCMPGGKIMVYTGLIEKLNATDDELAAVIGHEIAHALREHGRERMSQAYVQQFGLQALSAFVTKGAAGGAIMQGAGTWATVGSCAQIGKNVHLSGGVGIGGVLEPVQAGPTIIGDNCFIGARSEVVEGVVVEDNCVISMGVYIGQSTKIYDRETGEVFYGRVPAGSVVVSGNLPSKDGSYSLYCAVIVKKVDAKTLGKVGINELLRGI